jgi:hypothetical protein
MKLLFSILFLLLNFSAHAQSEWVIKLSTQAPDARMGVWTKGDYSILVSLDSLSSYLRRSQHDLKRSIDYYVDKDSNLLNYFTATAQRYNVAATLTENAKNGFDLKTLRIYEGIENSNRNLEDSRILESYIKQLAEQQKAIVFYKGQRIFTLCYTSESNNNVGELTVSEILNHGYTTKAFFDQPDNCLFHEFYLMGW